MDAGPALCWSFGSVRLRFSVAADGDMGDRERRLRWLLGCAPRRWLVPRQVHGAVVADADRDDGLIQRADGVVTADRDCGLAVLGADCPGLALIAPDARAVGHCGWRGCAAGMVAALVEALAARSAHAPGDWIALIGPGIGGARYEVDEPVLSARAWPPAALRPSRPGRALLDLGSALEHDLRAQGVGRIERSGVCTAADPRLHSYRHGGRGCSQLLACWIGRFPGP